MEQFIIRECAFIANIYTKSFNEVNEIIGTSLTLLRQTTQQCVVEDI